MLAWHNFMKCKRDIVKSFYTVKLTPVNILDVIVPITFWLNGVHQC